MILEQEVEKLRAVRQRISQKCGSDPERLIEYYQQLSRELRASGRFRFLEKSSLATADPRRE